MKELHLSSRQGWMKMEDQSDASEASSGISGATPNSIKTIQDEVRNTHKVRLPQTQLHGAMSRGKQGRIPDPDSLHGRALKHHVPLVTHSMQVTPPA